MKQPVGRARKTFGAGMTGAGFGAAMSYVRDGGSVVAVVVCVATAAVGMYLLAGRAHGPGRRAPTR
jgi:uncharacterized membrane protein